MRSTLPPPVTPAAASASTLLTTSAGVGQGDAVQRHAVELLHSAALMSRSTLALIVSDPPHMNQLTVVPAAACRTSSQVS